MFGKAFTHSTLRTYITGFGALFNDIWISRKDADKDEVQKVKVPIIYASKEQYYSRLTEKTAKQGFTLPALAYVITGMTRADDRRKAAKSEKVMIKNGIYGAEQPSEWKIDITLSIITGSQTDMNSIVEQICPYFDPSFSIKLKLLEDTIDYVDTTVINMDPTISLEENNFEAVGNTGDKRRLTWSMNFYFYAKIFGPVYVMDSTVDLSTIPFDIINPPASLGKRIAKVIVDTHSGGESGKYFDYPSLDEFPRVQRISVEEIENEIVITNETFNDGKVRNIVPDPLDVDEID